MTRSNVPAGPPASAADVHPGRINVGQHLPYTGREVEIFSRYGYFYPPGYLPNTTYAGFRGLATQLTSTQFGMKPTYFRSFGIGAAKLFGCFLLFYLPLDNLYCDLRKKVNPQRRALYLDTTSTVDPPTVFSVLPAARQPVLRPPQEGEPPEEDPLTRYHKHS
ncbi:uncharacterized protein EMH_0047530 [Eimeria mitis]|uniref:Uncharacterized protein n=1 Tax=Eimeria mitis TaxID=44415 RepID=U6K086_9EIME|nr:uncharacterized protein EMH_0047530 [Eimeria mitis]CDJ29178.1 hypothetical protein, conserved [Eimeria mitis]